MQSTSTDATSLVSLQTITVAKSFLQHLLFTRAYFDHVRRHLKSAPNILVLRVAIGNEGCDLDSFASALVLSYLSYLQWIGPICNRPDTTSTSQEAMDTRHHGFFKQRRIKHALKHVRDWLVLPIVFTTRELFLIRGDCRRAAELCDIPLESLIFIDELLDLLRQCLPQAVLEEPGQPVSTGTRFPGRAFIRRSSFVLSDLVPAELRRASTTEPDGHKDTQPSFERCEKYVELDALLVDQPSLPLYLKNFVTRYEDNVKLRVSCIIDHHREDPAVRPYLMRRWHRHVRFVASNMTLLVDELRALLDKPTRHNVGAKLGAYLDGSAGLDNRPLLRLMLGTILLDSMDLDPSTGKTTDLDCKMVKWLCDGLASKSANKDAGLTLRKELFQDLLRAKIASNVSTALKASLALEKDFKLYELPQPGSVAPLIYGISSIGISMHEWCAKAKREHVTDSEGGEGEGKGKGEAEDSGSVGDEGMVHKPGSMAYEPVTVVEQESMRRVLLDHMAKYSLDFFLIIAAFQDDAVQPPLLQRQLALFVPLRSPILALLRHSNASSTYEAEVYSQTAGGTQLADDLVVKALGSGPSVAAGTGDGSAQPNLMDAISSSMLFYGVLGQSLIDILKLVDDPTRQPGFVVRSEATRPVKRSSVQAADFLDVLAAVPRPQLSVLTCFAQLDTTYSRKKVQPLLHQRFKDILKAAASSS